MDRGGGNRGNRGNGGLSGGFRGGSLENRLGVGGGEFPRHHEDVLGERSLERVVRRLHEIVETWKRRKREAVGRAGGRAPVWRAARRNRCLRRTGGPAFDRIRSAYEEFRGVGGAESLLGRFGEETSNQVLRWSEGKSPTRAESGTKAGNSMDSGAKAEIFSKMR